MHAVARRGAAQVGQAGAADQAMGRVVMIQRRQHPSLLQQPGIVRAWLAASAQHLVVQAAARANRRQPQFARAAHAAQHLYPGAFDDADPALPARSSN